MNLSLLSQLKIYANYNNNNNLDISGLFDFFNFISGSYSNNKIDDKNKLNNFKKEYKLVYIYTSKCGFCKKFSPVLKNFVNKHKIYTESLTEDGIKIKYFQNAKHEPNRLDELNVRAYPTVVAVNKINKNDYYLLTRGYLNKEGLYSRFNELLDDIY